MAVLSPVAKQQFFDNNGNPASGYKLYTYAANTTTPQATYSNAAGTSANANPIILNSRGEATIFLDPSLTYDFVLKTSADATVWTQEDVSSPTADATNAIRGDTGKKYRSFGGVIRQTAAGAGWAFIDDASHTPIGLTSITENADGTLTVTNAFTAASVGTIAVTPDEDYTAAGLVVGASVAESSQVLTFYAPFEARMSNLTVAWGNYITTTGSLFGCDTSTAASDGKVVFTHPTISHVDSTGSPIVIMKYMPAGITNGNAEIVATTVGKSGFTLQAMEPIAGKVVTDGSGGITVTSDLVTTPTASWNSSNNRLTITHPQSLSAFGYNVQAITSTYSCRVTSSTGTTLVIAFYDWAGTLYTGATAPVNFQLAFSVPGTAPGLWSSLNRLVIRRALVKIRCQDIYGNGNFWIAGTHEVA